MDITWVLFDAVLAIHKRQISEHGGSDGVRDEGLLSALAHPQNRQAYSEGADVAALAAYYAFGIAKNHPFIDGNKRTALVVMRTFLSVNGYIFQASQEEKYTTFLKLAEGSLNEDEVAIWVRSKIT
ncbi:MAG: type II toxin-antitoxin system death-on-curing family toxin [Pyrinomonadaceae bacterium]